MTIHVLITATATNKQELEYNKLSYLSMCNQETEHLVDVMIDTRIHKGSQTEKVNEWLSFWRGKDYEYLCLMTNDSIAHKHAIEFMTRAMNEDKSIDLLTCKFNRNLESFNNDLVEYIKPWEFNPDETGSFFIRRGVIEEIGIWNPAFPHEYNEREYLYRMRKAQKKVLTMPTKLFYHPPYSQENSVGRQGIHIARANYVATFGGDWMQETK